MTTIDAESSGTAVERRRRRSGSQDRKSTRLNSSHLVISYAVFCLKKKKKYHIKVHSTSPESEQQGRVLRLTGQAPHPGSHAHGHPQRAREASHQLMTQMSRVVASA